MPTTPRNLEYYRKQARALLNDAHSGDTAALKRISDHSLPKRQSAISDASVTLSDAQRAIAHEQGFSNWARFRKSIIGPGVPDTLTEFVDAALNNLAEADRILATHPEIEPSSNLTHSLLLGDVNRVRAELTNNPEAAVEPTGPRNWAPLLYICFSRYGSRESERRLNIAELGRLLLAHGADPNGFYMPVEWPDNPLSCLYGASGLNNNPELTQILLDAGGNPDDNESMYHSTEHPDHECLSVLIKGGANVNGKNILFHALDRDDVEMIRMLFDAGADPAMLYDDKETALHWAVWRARSVEVVRELIQRGVDMNAPREDGRTTYVMAYLSGQTEVAELLAASGADTTISTVDRFVGDFAAAPDSQIESVLQKYPAVASDQTVGRVLSDLSMSHRTAAVRALIKAGVDVDSRGVFGRTALHWACWSGYSDIVKLLLDAGASLTIQEDEFHSTPPGWFGHGSKYCPDRTGDWVGVARELAEAGAVIPPAELPTGLPEVDAVLREYGYMKA